MREQTAHPFSGEDVHRTSSTTPPHLPVSGERVIDINRLRWRSRRGLLELDIVLKDFLDRRYSGLTPAEQEAFERLLTLSDETLLAYVLGHQNPPEKELMQLVSKIRN